MNLYTHEQVQRARKRVAEEPTAQKIADAIFKTAAPWLNRDTDTIRSLMPDAWVPRTRHITPATFTRAYATGCPVHHTPAPDFRGYPQHDWIYNPFVDRWRITCPEGGETYPSNDFDAYYHTRDRNLLTGPHPDDGYGWCPEGSPYKFWFIGHCCDRMWRLVMDGLTALSRAYLLTGDAPYAHKALVILDRLAEVYPEMDHSKQSMYALDLSPGYSGKLFNLISETGTVTQLSRALDAVRDALPTDPAFGPETLTKLEHGILGASLEGIYSGLVRGNYGMHQEALLHAAIATGDQKEIDRAIDWVLNNTGEATALKEMRTAFDDYIFRDKSAHAEGINFALDSLLFREGVGWESSPSYNRTWVSHLTVIATLLDRVGVRIHDRPKFRRMYRWPVEMTCLDLFTPAVGDAGSVDDGLILPGATDIEAAYRLTGDPFLAAYLKKYKLKATGFDTLFEEPVDLPDDKAGNAELKQLTAESHLMAGYGLGLLRSGKGKHQAAISLYYGRAATEHAHFDRLNLELFALGRKLTPDLGYGDHASEGDPPAIWTKNTAAHNTVVVDERRQDTQAPGKLEGFVSTEGLQFMDVDASAAYQSVSEYRRTLALIDITPTARYALDLFRVTGGQQHDYGLHGFDAAFETSGIDFGPEQPGTLAGPDVPFGTIHDDDGLADPLKKGRSYYTYRGSGYSYLTHIRAARPNSSWTATWKDPATNEGLRTFFLPTEEAFLAQIAPSRRAGNPDTLTRVLLRNRGDALHSSFVTIAEPFSGSPSIQDVELLGRTEQTITLAIRHTHGEDTVAYSVTPQGPTFSLVRRNTDGNITQMDRIGTGQTEADRTTLSIHRPLSGRIVSIDPETTTVEIERDKDSQPFRTRGLVGNVVRIYNGRRVTAYTLSAVESHGRRYRLHFGKESFCIGRFKIGPLNPDGSGLTTPTNLYMASQGYYQGARLVNETLSAWHPVTDVTLAPHNPGQIRDATIRLEGTHDLSDDFTSNHIAYLYDFGPGDRISILPRATALRRKDGSFRIQANCKADLSTT